MKRYYFLLGFALFCFALGAGLFYAYDNTNQSKPVPVKPISLINQPRPDFHLLNLHKKNRDISAWNSKVILLNFWATWCPPCRHEIPGFIKLYDKYKNQGLVIIGVALNSRQSAIKFLEPMGINYPILMAQNTGLDLMTQRYGNDMGVLPYTVVIDRNGVIRKTVAHAISEKQAEQLIKPLL